MFRVARPARTPAAPRLRRMGQEGTAVLGLLCLRPPDGRQGALARPARRRRVVAEHRGQLRIGRLGAWLGYQERMGEPLPAAKPPPGLKPKDLVGIPERVVLALQADGWYWRDRIAWTKGSAMPSSHTDRCTASFEFVYMFAKQERHYYDLEAVKEPVAVPGVSGIPFGGVRRAGGDNPTYSGRDYTAGETRTRRNVWHVNPEGFGLEFCQSCETIYIPSEHKRLRSESRVDPETGNERVIRFCGCGADPEEA